MAENISVGPDDLLKIIGAKEVEIQVLRAQSADLEKRLAASDETLARYAQDGKQTPLKEVK